MLIIGNEVLSGRTQDANLQFLATRLNEIGIRMAEARVIADDEAGIIAAINECRAKYDYVFTTGGIGPTHDDITAACVARAFGVELERNEIAVNLLAEHVGRDNLNESRLKMAEIPVGASLIDNPVSKAPGFRMENVFVMAGIPKIMQAMFASLRHQLQGGEPMKGLSVSSLITEGSVAAGLSAIQDRYPDVEIGSYPFVRVGKLGTSLVVRGIDEARLRAALEEIKGLVRSLGGDPVEETTA